MDTPTSPTTAQPPAPSTMAGHPARPPSMGMHRSKQSASRITHVANGSVASDDDAKTAVKVGRFGCCVSVTMRRNITDEYGVQLCVCDHRSSRATLDST